MGIAKWLALSLVLQRDNNDVDKGGAHRKFPVVSPQQFFRKSMLTGGLYHREWRWEVRRTLVQRVSLSERESWDAAAMFFDTLATFLDWKFFTSLVKYSEKKTGSTLKITVTQWIILSRLLGPALIFLLAIPFFIFEGLIADVLYLTLLLPLAFIVSLAINSVFYIQMVKIVNNLAKHEEGVLGDTVEHCRDGDACD